MASTAREMIRLVPLALGSIALLSGCFTGAQDCERVLTCDVGGVGVGGAGGTGGAPDAGPQCIDDPVSALAVDDCGIFVSSSLGNDKNPGTRAAPVQTIAHALDLAAEAKQRVYACAELFQEAVEMPSGLTLFGGLDCHDKWTYIGASVQTMIKYDGESREGRLWWKPQPDGQRG